MASTLKLTSISKACRLGDKIFKKLIANIRRFKSEKEIEKFLFKEMIKLGVTKAFPPIVASGKNAANPHHNPTDEKLNNGFCVIDFGIRINKYCSDMTRTIYIGKPTRKEAEDYKIVLQSQLLSIKRIKVGGHYKELDNYSRRILGRKRKWFIHSLGHGLGIWIHMKPRISPKSEEIIKVGDIITIEPGIYKKNKLGIRIEDTLIVNQNNVKILTQSPKKLIIIPKVG